ncbi:hypothetical protein ScPMuIL_006764 [Solemya velum]
MFRSLSVKKKSDKTDTGSGTVAEEPPHPSRVLHTQISQQVLDTLFVDFSKSLWHAFNSLAHDEVVQKSRLKVIVSTIGRELGFENAQAILDQHTETELDFLKFFSIIKYEMLDKIKAESEERKLLTRPDFTQIHRVCWMLCSNKTLSTKDKAPPEVDPIIGVVSQTDSCNGTEDDEQTSNLQDDNAFKLWRVFNFFVESDYTGNPSIPLRLDVEEAVQIYTRFTAISGQLRKERELHFISDVKDEITFELFLELFVKHFASDICPAAQTYTINLLYENVVLDTMKKGTLSKHGKKLNNWKEYFFVLTSKQLTYYLASDECELKRVVPFDDSWELEIPPEDMGPRSHKFVVFTPMKVFELTAASFQKKYQWISAFKKVIEHNKDHFEDGISVERQMALERKKKRDERRAEAEAVTQRLFEQANLLKDHAKLLEQERLDRAMIQANLMEETALRRSEQIRCQNLELEMAKNVREEIGRREEIQKLCDEQRKMYEEEHSQLKSVEYEREKGTRLLQDAKEKLELLEVERDAALEKLEDAAQRLKVAEEIRSKMESAFKDWKTKH